MKISLILGTLNRIEELDRFFSSLIGQTYQDFEIIVVDQNTDNKVSIILESLPKNINIIHLKNSPGLSRARNLGLTSVSGDIIAFPDDDCWYPIKLLEEVNRFFVENNNYDGLTVKPVDENSNNLSRKSSGQCGEINKNNVFGYGKGISYCIFLRKNLTDKVGKFDEDLGVGAGTPWGAGEETDYLIRALDTNHRIFHDPNLHVYHPQKSSRKSIKDETLNRILPYSRGKGRVLKKNRYPISVLISLCLKSLFSSCYDLFMYKNISSFKVGFLRITGLISGWYAKP